VAAESGRKIEIGQKIQQNIAHALLADDCQSPSVKTPKQNGASS
jgi:hypothetical protein